MTHDLALKQSIMIEEAPKRRTRAERPRKERKSRKTRPFWVTLVIRSVMLVISAIVLRVMMYTPQGEAMIQQAAEQIAALMASSTVEETAEAQAVEPVSPQTGVDMLRGSGTEVGTRPKVSAMPGSQGTVRRLNP